VSAPAAFGNDLARLGVRAADPWELVNRKDPYPAAIPALVDWLARVDVEVEPRERAKFREGLVRSLAVREARGIAGPTLVCEFRRTDVESTYRWAVANALEVVADDSLFIDVVELARDRRYGADRQMLVLAMARMKDPRVVDVLVELLADDEVAGHAAKALARLKMPLARPALERLLVHPRPWVRAEARKALKRMAGSR